MSASGGCTQRLKQELKWLLIIVAGLAVLGLIQLLLGERTGEVEKPKVDLGGRVCRNGVTIGESTTEFGPGPVAHGAVWTHGGLQMAPGGRQFTYRLIEAPDGLSYEFTVHAERTVKRDSSGGYRGETLKMTYDYCFSAAQDLVPGTYTARAEIRFGAAPTLMPDAILEIPYEVEVVPARQ